MNEGPKVKQFFQKVSQVISIFVAAAGLPLTAYGVWFQTENFKWASLKYCVLLAVAVLGTAFLMMQYLDDQISSKKAGTLTSKNAGRSVIQGSWIAFFCGMVFLYFCTSLLTFYIGLGVMLFAWGCLVFHLILSRSRKKKEEKGAA
ncbi:MAG: hypothetical protein IJL43_02730 [Lachnospiraceae bacterium]|nr:hypothetical protein [Lachnospiraceae bacterium]